MADSNNKKSLFRFYRDAQELINSVYAVGLFALLGWWADSSTGRSPLFLVISILAGMTYAGFSVARFLKRMEANQQKDDSQ